MRVIGTSALTRPVAERGAANPIRYRRVGALPIDRAEIGCPGASQASDNGTLREVVSEDGARRYGMVSAE